MITASLLRLSVLMLAVFLSLIMGTVSLPTGAEAKSPENTPRPSTRPELSLTERALLAGQLAGGVQQTLLWIMTESGRSSEVARKVTDLGGEVWANEQDIDLLRVKVPIVRLEEIINWPQVTAAQIELGDDINVSGLTGDYQSNSFAKPEDRPGIPPSAYTSRDNAYTAESATESLQFKTAHPTYDGRGVTIGAVEPVNPRTPSLSWALNLQGARVPKIADYLMLVPPLVTTEAIPAPGTSTSIGDWHNTVLVHPNQAGQITFNHKIYHVPVEVESQELRLTLFRTNASDLSPELTILWAVEDGKVWICNRQQTDFREGIALTLSVDQPNRAAITQVGTDPARTLRLTVAPLQRAIGVIIGWGDHGTMCASTATGHSFLNSQAEGIAPGAQLLVVPSPVFIDSNGENPRPSTGLESFLALFREPRVDLITDSGGAGMGAGRRMVADERLIGWHFFDRLSACYPKLFFAAAGNGGPVAQIGGWEESSSEVVTVGAYTPRQAWEANFGITPTLPNTPAPYSQYGPTSDGALKPDLLGLVGSLCAVVPSPQHLHVFESPYYVLPEGYGITGGTSGSTPNAAAHAALLISAAKQTGLPSDPARLKMALFSTARFLDGVEARVQGHGLVQVDQAWAALQKLRDYHPATFITRAPVHTFWSAQLAAQNTGRGLYEKEGWAPGQSGDRQLIITRTSGSRHPITYRLRWHESPGAGVARLAGPSEQFKPAFTSSISEITLPLNQAVTLPIHIAIGSSGAYSAIVDLIDPTIGLAAHSVLCTVIVAEQLNSQNGYTTTVSGSAPHPGSGLVFVNVPAGATALRIEVEQQNGKKVSLNAKPPDGRTLRAGASDANPWLLPPSDRKHYDQTFINPQSGVWQFWLTHDFGGAPASYDPTESRPALACEFTMRISAFGVASPVQSPATEESARVTFTNNISTIDQARVEPVGLGARRETDAILKPVFSPTFYGLEVPAGTAKIEAGVDADPDPPQKGNISLVIVRITGDKKSPVAYATFDVTPGLHKQVELKDPKPGQYEVCLDAWGKVPAEGLKVHYYDTIFHPLYGSVSAADTPARLSVGQTRSVSISWNVHARPLADRKLIAEVGLFCDGCVTMDPSDWLAAFRTAIAAGRRMPEQSSGVTNKRVPVAIQTVVLPDL